MNSYSIKKRPLFRQIVPQIQNFSATTINPIFARRRTLNHVIPIQNLETNRRVRPINNVDVVRPINNGDVVRPIHNGDVVAPQLQQIPQQQQQQQEKLLQKQQQQQQQQSQLNIPNLGGISRNNLLDKIVSVLYV